ncbi:hypothetical protein H0H87_005341 [Tephrocybe sp. NHM501043]|nr:hypothetical protein H0H87_005341 [Tephrocybe sp. NHM501043]
MDACEHEYESMSRHNRKVPTSFYHRFARDACALSDVYAKGRLVSVLEGGYSDRALISGTMAHLSGLVDESVIEGGVNEEWWNVENLIKLEKATKKRRGGRPSLSTAANESWLERTVEIFQSLDSTAKLTPLVSRTLVPPSSMTLRDRKSKSPTPSPTPQPISSRRPKTVKPISQSLSSGAESSSSSSSGEGEITAPKKLPRVILRLGPDPSLPSRP